MLTPALSLAVRPFVDSSDFYLTVPSSWYVITPVKTGALVPIAALIGAAIGSDSLTAAVGTTAQRLPKVRVARDGRTFITETGKPFVPFGVTYYRPGTGWAPQIWKQFDPEATRKDFARMKQLGVNCLRVFLTFHSFYTDPGELRPEGLSKFDQFLALAEEAGVYVHPTGPDHWEGPPNWRPVAIGHEGTLRATEEFWKLFAARYRGRNVIFAYDLKNEPHVGWNVDILKPQWNAWLQKKYGTVDKLAAAWGATNRLELEHLPIPAPKDSLRSRQLLDYQAV